MALYFNLVVLASLISAPLSRARMDAPEPWQMGFQDPATPIAQGIMDLHHDLMFFYRSCSGFCIMGFSTYISTFPCFK